MSAGRCADSQVSSGTKLEKQLWKKEAPLTCMVSWHSSDSTMVMRDQDGPNPSRTPPKLRLRSRRYPRAFFGKACSKAREIDLRRSRHNGMLALGREGGERTERTILEINLLNSWWRARAIRDWLPKQLKCLNARMESILNSSKREQRSGPILPRRSDVLQQLASSMQQRYNNTTMETSIS